MPVTDFSYTEDPFIPDQPDKLMTEGAFPADINVIIGRTEDEGIIYLIGETSTFNHQVFFHQTNLFPLRCFGKLNTVGQL